MALDLEEDEELVYDGRMSWLGAILDWRTIITLSLWMFVNRYGSRYTVTNKRVYRRFGIISKTENVINRENVRDVALHQNILHRILRYGDVTVATAGTGGREINFKKVGNPSRVRQKIRDIK